MESQNSSPAGDRNFSDADKVASAMGLAMCTAHPEFLSSAQLLGVDGVSATLLTVAAVPKEDDPFVAPFQTPELSAPFQVTPPDESEQA